MDFKIEYSKSLQSKGSFVIKRNIRMRMRDYIDVNQAIQVYLNGKNLGGKMLNSDYRLLVGKELSNIVKENSDITVNIGQQRIDITVSNGKD